MKTLINKYRKNQSEGEEVVKKVKKYKKAKVGLFDQAYDSEDAGTDDAGDDTAVISAEGAAKLAVSAVIEDEILKEVEIETENMIKADAITPPTKRIKEDLGNRETVIREFAPLIKYIAQKIAARLPANIELDDLISSGVIGLMDAIDKYDSTRDNKFKTYAEFRIRGAILDELRAQDWVPRSVREKAKVLERAYARIEQNTGRPANEDDVCKELNIKKEEYHELLAEVRSISLLSYDDLTSVTKGERRGGMEFTDSVKAPTPLAELNTAHVKKLVSEAIRDLPEKQRLVLSLYYYEDLNLKEIGKVLDVTESRVSQLHTQAIIKLKTKLKGHFDEFVAMFS